MANITAALVKELRERTNAGMMDCKKALVESDGDMDKAIDWLREKGLAQAAKKAGRIAAEGAVVAYMTPCGCTGALVRNRLRCQHRQLQEFRERRCEARRAGEPG